MSTTKEQTTKRERIEASIEEILARMTEHALVEITAPDAPVRAFYLKKPNRRAESTLIVFTPEGIAIMGDQTPGAHGDVSRFGYGVEWFASLSGWDYLAGKFLSKRWVWESARDLMGEFAEQYEAAATDDDGEIDEHAAGRAKAYREIAADIDDSTTAEEFVEMLEEHGMGYDGEGWDFDPGEVALLAAIQRKFAALYTARAERGAA